MDMCRYDVPIPPTCALNLSPFLIHHPAPPTHIIRPSQTADLHLPHMFLAHQFINLVVEVADLEIAEAGLLDFGHLARDLLQHLAPPFLACWDRGDGGDGFGPSCARDVEDAE